MIKSIYLTFLFSIVLTCLNVNAQNGWQWLTGFGNYDFTSQVRDIPEKVILGSDGYLYMAGTIGPDLMIDSTGNFIINGVRYGLKNPSLGESDIWVAKYTLGGQQLWYRRAGSTSYDGFNSMVLDQNGDIYIAGHIIINYSSVVKSFDNSTLNRYQKGAFIAKLDTAGQLLWHKNFYGDTTSMDFLSTIFDGRISDIFVNNNQLKCIMQGSSYHHSYISPLFGLDTLQRGIYEINFDLSGNYLNYQPFPFPDTNHLPVQYDINYDDEGNYYFTHFLSGGKSVITTTDTIRSSNYWKSGTIAIDSALTPLWNYQSDSNFLDIGRDMTYFDDTLFMLTTYASNSITSIPFGNYTHNLPRHVTGGEGVVMLDSKNNGNVIGFIHNSYLSFGTSADVSAIEVNDDFIAIAGTFNGSLSFSGGLDTLTSRMGPSTDDVFFVVFDRDGNLILEESFAPTGYFAQISEMVIKDSSLFIGGVYLNTLNLTGAGSITSKYDTDIFFARYNFGTPLITSNESAFKFIKADNGILAYPNPTASGKVNLMGKAIHNEAQLYNISGQLVKSYRLSTNAFNQVISLEGLKTGMYFLMITDGNKRQQIKIVKQ